MTRRRRLALAVAALAAVAGYLGGSVWSASLSPLARRPLLDGTAPPVPYRWVDPPALLANTNRPPSAGRFEIPIGPNGSLPNVIATRDIQFTLVTDLGLVPASGDADRAEVVVEPLSPARFPPVPEGSVAAGNVYRVGVSYLPTGQVRRFGTEASAILTYPSLPTIHNEGHTMLFSPDGGRWTPLPTRETAELFQAEAGVGEPGYLLVSGRPRDASTATVGGGSSTWPVVVGVAVLAVVLIGAGLLLRARGDTPPPDGD